MIKFKKIILLVIGVFMLFIITGCGKKEFTVTFDSNGGSIVENQTVKENEYVTKPADPTKEGYNFLYWELDNDEYDFESEVAKDITLVAKYEEVSDTAYSITFNSKGGSSVVSQSIAIGSKPTKPENPTKEGYKFLYWELDGKEYNFDNDVTGNMTLVAKWLEKYTVTFDSDGGNNVKSQSIDSGSKATKPTNPTKSGYAFKGWYLNDKEYDFKSAVTKDLTLVAKWVEKYTVTFNSGGGSTVASQSIESGLKATKPTNPTRSGYSFQGWYLNDLEYNFNTAITKNVTLTAKWEVVVQYTVTFNSNGGSSVSPQSVISGGKATKPTNPSRSGYTFSDWYLNDSVYNFNTSVTGNITLVAHWQEVVVEDVYTVTSSFFQQGSPQVIITVKKNGSTVGATAVLRSNGETIGDNDNEFNVILINASEFDNIAKARLSGGTIVNITK